MEKKLIQIYELAKPNSTFCITLTLAVPLSHTAKVNLIQKAEFGIKSVHNICILCIFLMLLYDRPIFSALLFSSSRSNKRATLYKAFVYLAFSYFYLWVCMGFLCLWVIVLFYVVKHEFLGHKMP